MRRAIAAAVSVVGMLLLAGCSSNHAERMQIEPVALELQHSPTVRIVGAHVHPLNAHAVIHGRVRHQVWGASVLAGHVDLEVHTPDGQVLRHVNIPLDAATHPLTRSQDATFRLEVPNRVPQGSTLYVHYHTARHT